MKSFTKKQIEKMVLLEDSSAKIYKVNEIKLKENDGNAYVEPSSDSASSLASDLQQTAANNPTDNTFHTNLNSYDGNNSNNTVTLDIVGDNASDAAQKMQQTMRQPIVRNMMNKTNVNAKVHLKNEQIEKLRESSVKFTKTELSKLLQK